jgi:2'-5' RNA ligase
MRLFIALNLPKKERTRIHRAARALRERDLPVRWTEADDYHLTLKFLGDVRGGRRDPVEHVMEKVAGGTQPFEVTVRGFGAFPTIRKPRVLWVGAAATPELRCLKQDLEWGLAEFGFERETRAFHPHVTLGRADEEGGAGAFRGLDDVVAEMDHASAFTVRTLDLMRSKPTKTGSQYSVLRTIKLTGPR